MYPWWRSLNEAAPPASGGVVIASLGGLEWRSPVVWLRQRLRIGDSFTNQGTIYTQKSYKKTRGSVDGSFLIGRLYRTSVPTAVLAMVSSSKIEFVLRGIETSTKKLLIDIRARRDSNPRHRGP